MFILATIFLSVQFLLLLDFATYEKKIVISFGYYPKYISSIKKGKRKKKKKVVQKEKLDQINLEFS